MIYPKTPALLLSLALLACGAPYLPLPGPAPENPPQTPPEASCRITQVVDGDTVDMRCGGPEFRARLIGFDTPETHEPGCAAEAEAGAAATRRLRQMSNHAERVTADLGGWDRYDRRLVRLRLDGADVGSVLVNEGMAVPYQGGRRINWCARLG